MHSSVHSLQDPFIFTSYCIHGVTDSQSVCTVLVCQSHCDWGWGNPKEEGIIQALEKSNTYWVRQAGKQLTRLTARLAKTEQR